MNKEKSLSSKDLKTIRTIAKRSGGREYCVRYLSYEPKKEYIFSFIRKDARRKLKIPKSRLYALLAREVRKCRKKI